MDRALNDRPGVRNARERVLDAHRKLSRGMDAEPSHRIRLICESGITFNRASEEAADAINWTCPEGGAQDRLYGDHQIRPDRVLQTDPQNWRRHRRPDSGGSSEDPDKLPQRTQYILYTRA